jgi:hypothetical protein
MGQPETPPQVGVVIVSYNTRDLLRDCLHSLRGCMLPLRVLVVDNGSADGSATLVREQFPEVHLLARADNPGFAAGNNLGLRWLGYGNATADSAPPYALLLNPDTVVHSGAVEGLVAFLEAHPRVGLVGPRLLNSDGSIQAAAFRFPTLSMSLLDVFPPGEVLPGRLYGSWWHGRYPQEQNAAAPFAIDHPLGACMLVRHRTLAEIGLLDEHYFMYGEEIDWCWRMRRRNWAIWQVPAAQVTHIGGASTGQFRARMLIELHRSRVQLFRRYRGPTFVRAHRLITRAGMLRAMLRDWAAYARGHLPRAELRARLWAYGMVCRL